MARPPVYLGITAAFLITGCASSAAPSDPTACGPVQASFPPSATVSPMVGRFTITMAATVGATAGASVAGSMILVARDSSLVEPSAYSQPLVGTADIALEAVGAVRMGDLAATDPLAPGVAVYEQQVAGTTTVLVRLGSASNARGPAAFDAGHTTLYVRRIAADGFAGGWASSAGSTYPMQEARGYFCAVRAQP